MISNEGAVCILPNSLEGRHLDIQGNIYAFGILLLEIISGRPPYSKDKGCLVDWVSNNETLDFFFLFFISQAILCPYFKKKSYFLPICRLRST